MRTTGDASRVAVRYQKILSSSWQHLLQWGLLRMHMPAAHSTVLCLKIEHPHEEKNEKIYQLATRPCTHHPRKHIWMALRDTSMISHFQHRERSSRQSVLDCCPTVAFGSNSVYNTLLSHDIQTSKCTSPSHRTLLSHFDEFLPCI